MEYSESLMKCKGLSPAIVRSAGAEGSVPGGSDRAVESWLWSLLQAELPQQPGYATAVGGRVVKHQMWACAQRNIEPSNRKSRLISMGFLHRAKSIQAEAMTSWIEFS